MFESASFGDGCGQFIKAAVLERYFFKFHLIQFYFLKNALIKYHICQSYLRKLQMGNLASLQFDPAEAGIGKLASEKL